MDAQEYERLSNALARGHSVRLNGQPITRQADLDAAAGEAEGGAPSPREQREAQLGKLNKAQLTERAVQLELPTDGTNAELAARILEMEFPAAETP